MELRWESTVTGSDVLSASYVTKTEFNIAENSVAAIA